MSLNFSRKNVLMTIGLPVWVFVGFMLAQILLGFLVEGLVRLGLPLGAFNATFLNVVSGILVYALAIVIIVGVPWYLKKYRTTKTELGIQRLPIWMDIAWALTGFVGYIILSAIISTIANHLPFIDMNQAQDTGYNDPLTQINYILTFIGLVLVPPLAEELIFRGYLFGKLQKYTKLWISILITSALFGIVHFNWSVGLDVFALSVAACFIRVYSGSLWSSIFLHMTKNGIAYFFLFINPHLLSTLIK